MNSIVANFTSLEGRIGRQSWWIGAIILLVVQIVVGLLILPLVGVSMMPNIAAIMADPNNVDAAAIANSVAASMRTASWIGVVLALIFAYPIAALGVKRRHDKDNSGLDVWIFVGLLVLSPLLQALGLATTMAEVPMGGSTVSMPVPSLVGVIVSIIVFVYLIYLLVVLGFLKGTTGPNQYGPDPLGGTA